MGFHNRRYGAKVMTKTLVLTAHGLNLAYLGCYGSDWSATPHLDELAASAIVFDEHYGDRPDSAGAWHSWHTGRYSFISRKPKAGASVLTPLLAARGIVT